MPLDEPIAYYNENDPFAAAWLEKLIDAGLIANGWVDTRSIEDVPPEDLDGFTQCHFFAGIGGWSYALRLAGWPDDRPCWTGSCPCQPYSAAGKGKGFADERHLWPSWFHLIGEHLPPVIFGEQVTTAIKHGWLDLVQDDLEGIGYEVWAHGMAACNIGSPHQRKRLYFVADTGCSATRRGSESNRDCATKWSQETVDSPSGSEFSGLAFPYGWNSGAKGLQRSGQQRQQPTNGGVGIGMGHAEHSEWRAEHSLNPKPYGWEGSGGPSRVDGFWADAEWLWCRDEKYRPVEPGTFPLAHGVSNRVGRLRGYGNAIVPQAAQAFIEAYMSIR